MHITLYNIDKKSIYNASKYHSAAVNVVTFPCTWCVHRVNIIKPDNNKSRGESNPVRKELQGEVGQHFTLIKNGSHFWLVKLAARREGKAMGYSDREYGRYTSSIARVHFQRQIWCNWRVRKVSGISLVRITQEISHLPFN